ncbi:MAG: hypothetical protein KDA24_14830 [Deltaproteobacteria bacterium]|nr:hypothetical protein [Deltaproteobacteria bacterium]
MSQSNPAIALGAVVALGVLGLVVWSTQSPPAAADEALAQRVAALEEDVASLREQIDSRRARGERRGRGGGRRGPEASAAMNDEDLARSIAREARRMGPPDRPPENLDEVLAADDPAVRERVGELVRDTLEEERESRMERRRERMEQRTAERLTQLSDDAGLDGSQVDRLDSALTQEREDIFALFRAAREDGTWADAREKADALREATDEQVRSVLDEEQLQAWDAFRVEEAERRGR